MSEFWLYLKLGLTHVLDWKAYDHVLFLIVLIAAYTFSNWQRILVLVSVFTLGHTLSLFLASFELISINKNLVEFLIPLTILIAALYNIMTSGKAKNKSRNSILYGITLFFGLIHGLGFASFFIHINDEGHLLPLLEFALGIEAAQIVVVFIVLVLAFIGQFILRFNKRDWILIVSSVVIGMVIPMLVENSVF
ncbi:MAG: HupE/UreJ family protein [Flavobacteriaceae bacterium]|nr:HupE/UreJ family protein [Flavobacteriaceae bacterium]